MNLADADLKPGDLLFTRGRSWFGWLIRLWQWLRGRQYAGYSHVAIVVGAASQSAPWPGSGLLQDRDWLVEAVPGGVACWPISWTLAEADLRGERVYWHQLDEDLVDRAAVKRFAIQAIGAPYAKARQFAVSFVALTKWFRRAVLRRPVEDVDPQGWFCSELAVAALQTGGYVPQGDENALPVATDPGALACFSCLKPMGEVTP